MSDEKRQPWWPTPQEQKANREYLERLAQPSQNSYEDWFGKHGQAMSPQVAACAEEYYRLSHQYDEAIKAAYEYAGIPTEAAIPREAPSIEEQREAPADVIQVSVDGVTWGDLIPGCEISADTCPYRYARYKNTGFPVRGFALPRPQPTPPPRALPFKRHPMCSVAHAAIVGDRNCLGCERLIAKEMAALDYPTKPTPLRPEPHTLAPSGMCGPILSRLR